MTQPGNLGGNVRRSDDWIAKELIEVKRRIRSLVTPAGGGGSSFTRTSSTYVTAALAAGASEEGNIALATGYRLSEISLNTAARVRVYTSVADRTTDEMRDWGTDPEPGIGLILDYLTTGDFDGRLSPEADGFSTETVPSSDIPIRIESVLGGAVTLTLTWIRTE